MTNINLVESVGGGAVRGGGEEMKILISKRVNGDFNQKCIIHIITAMHN